MIQLQIEFIFHSSTDFQSITAFDHTISYRLYSLLQLRVNMSYMIGVLYQMVLQCGIQKGSDCDIESTLNNQSQIIRPYKDKEPNFFQKGPYYKYPFNGLLLSYLGSLKVYEIHIDLSLVFNIRNFLSILFNVDQHQNLYTQINILFLFLNLRYIYFNLNFQRFIFPVSSTSKCYRLRSTFTNSLFLCTSTSK